MIDLPTIEGGFKTIVVDPPWSHQSWSPKGQTRRSPSHHYPTMTIGEICALPVADVAAKDCSLFLWTTQPHLELAFRVMKAWRFKYSSVHTFWFKLRKNHGDAIWVNDHDVWRGLGFTTRKSVELLLLGRRGSPKRLVKDMPDFLFAPVREHSRKPDQAMARIERYCAGPRLELFSRQPREGWTAWGNETEKFAPAAEPDDLGDPDVVIPFPMRRLVSA